MSKSKCLQKKSLFSSSVIIFKSVFSFSFLPGWHAVDQTSVSLPLMIPLASPGMPGISVTLFWKKYSSQWALLEFSELQKFFQSLLVTVSLPTTAVFPQTSNKSRTNVRFPNIQILHMVKIIIIRNQLIDLITFSFKYYILCFVLSSNIKTYGNSGGWKMDLTAPA